MTVAGEPAPVCFVDSNILVYAMAKDSGERGHAAQKLLIRLMKARALCTSTQVLQETFVTLTRKGLGPLSPADALRSLDEIAEFPVIALEYAMIREAGQLSAREPISFWDALILVAAKRARATKLYTEDLQHGRTILGVKIENPFR